MISRKNIIVVIISLLIIFNLIRWWPDSDDKQKIESWQGISASQLQVHGIDIGADTNLSNTRDIFNLQIDDSNPSENKSSEQKIILPVVPSVANKNDNDASTRFKLIGVVIKNGRHEAFILNGSNSYNAHINDRIESRYKVEKISLDDVTLRDTSKGRLHIIPLSGGSSVPEKTKQSSIP